MATIVFSTVGTMFGGPLGGAIGALVGRQVDGALFGIPNRQGARLKELSVTTSTYGDTVPRHYGRMRVGGSIIWATDLVEHSDTQGGGKGSPSLTTYSYSTSFAVALASRPILGVGRVWADGKLLRGEDGVLKAGGSLRIHNGFGDQAADPLLIASEGEGRCPAYRGLAYVVFEDLDLSDFYNRVPNLAFEVIADEGFDLGNLVGDVLDEVDAAVPLEGMTGFSCDGRLADALASIDSVIPIEMHASGEKLIISPARLQGSVWPLPAPAIGVADDSFGSQTGFSRRRDPVAEEAPVALRYYDTDRDYLPGLQRAATRAGPGEPRALELPAALSAATARGLIERTARRGDWSRDRISWRTAELDTRIGPGALVSLPQVDGVWRVGDWEWREAGVELSLSRVFPEVDESGDASVSVDAGRFNAPSDQPAEATLLAAFELPKLALASPGDGPSLFAALSSASPGWGGAALFADAGSGELVPIGGSGKARNVMGVSAVALPAASPHLLDRSSQLTVQLAAADLVLAEASAAQLALGANVALLGDELIQFGLAEPAGGGLWHLRNLWRGRCGTEYAIAGHGAGERFVLIDRRIRELDATKVGLAANAAIQALGRGDEEPVSAQFGERGVSLRPPAPVHGRVRSLADGSTRLEWTRRARGAWSWLDGVDVPLAEDREAYLVSAGDVNAPLRMWRTADPWLELTAAEMAALAALASGQALAVRQEGSQAISRPLILMQFA